MGIGLGGIGKIRSQVPHSNEQKAHDRRVNIKSLWKSEPYYGVLKHGGEHLLQSS